MGEADKKERLLGPVLPACSAPSSGGFQCDSNIEKAQLGPQYEKEEYFMSIPTDDMQPLTIHLVWIIHILNYTQQIFNLNCLILLCL